MWFYCRATRPNDADRMANSAVDSDQKSRTTTVWPESALFAQTCLSKNLGSLQSSVQTWSFFSLIQVCFLKCRSPVFSFSMHLSPEYVKLSHDKTSKMACAPSEDSDQPGYLPSMIRVFAVRMKKHWVFSLPLNALRRLWSDLADAQADLSLPWAQRPFCWFCHEVAHLSDFY